MLFLLISVIANLMYVQQRKFTEHEPKTGCVNTTHEFCVIIFLQFLFKVEFLFKVTEI